MVRRGSEIRSFGDCCHPRAGQSRLLPSVAWVADEPVSLRTRTVRHARRARAHRTPHTRGRYRGRAVNYAFADVVVSDEPAGVSERA